MSKANCTFRINDAKRAYAAATKAGMKVGAIEFEPNGKIIVIAASDTGEKLEAVTYFDAWKLKRADKA
jgi:hypothetical protein